MIKRFKKDIFFIAILFILFIASHSIWFFSDSIIAAGDWIPQYPETLASRSLLPQSWTSSGLSEMNIEMSFYPQHLASSLLARLGFGYGMIERFIYLFPIAFFSCISSYFLIKKISRSQLGAFLGTLIFTYNSYFLILEASGHLLLRLSFAIAPLIILFFIKALEKKGLFWASLVGLGGFLVSSYDFRAYYILAWLMFFTFIYHILFIESNWTRENIFKISARALWAVLLTMILNAYWFFPLLFSGAQDSGKFSRELFGDQFIDILYGFALFQPFWSGGEVEMFKMNPIPFYLWLLPVFVFWGWWLKRKDKYVSLFCFFALLGIFLVKQSHEPFVGVYQWLFVHLPMFNAFRESSKFFFIVVLAYSVLIGMTAAFFQKFKKIKHVGAYLKYAVIFYVIMITCVNIKPLVTREIGTMFVAKNMPSDYVVFRDFIRNQDSYFRTLAIPSNSFWNYYSDQNPRINAVDATSEIWAKAVFGSQAIFRHTIAESIMDVVNSPNFDFILNISSVKYVLIPAIDKGNDNNIFGFYGKEREYYLDNLGKLSYLKKIDVGSKSLQVYENFDYLPHIFLSDNIPGFHNKYEVIKIDYSRINSTEYHARISGLKQKSYLNFGERYNEAWKLLPVHHGYFEALTSKINFRHYQNRVDLQGFELDPDYILNNFDKKDYKLNEDGSIDVDLKIFFKPQAYVYLFSLVSLAALIISVGFVCMILRKRFKQRLNSDK